MLSSPIKPDDDSASPPLAAGAAAAATMLWPTAAAAATFPPFMINDKGEMFATAAAGSADFTTHMGGFYPGQRWAPVGAGGPVDPFGVDSKEWATMNYNAFATAAAATTNQTTQLHPYDPYPSTSMASGMQPQQQQSAAAAAVAAATMPYPYGMMTYDCWAPGKKASSTTPNSSDSSSTSLNSLKLRVAAAACGVSKPDRPLNLPYKTGPGTNNVRVRTQDKYRMVYSDYIRLELEKEFHMAEFITADRKADLAAKLNLTERQIKIWFQNRRAKKRRDEKGSKCPQLPLVHVPLPMGMIGM